jgi:hypothetical protein
LWPEGAVSFSSASDKNAAFKEIRHNIRTSPAYWAVSFEENILDADEHTSIRRTGVAILSGSGIPGNNSEEEGDGIEMVYYKRFLVPSKS